MGPLPKEGQIKLTKFQEKTATMTYVYGKSFYWINVQSHVVLIFLVPALLCIIVKWSERKQGSSPEGDKVL